MNTHKTKLDNCIIKSLFENEYSLKINNDKISVFEIDKSLNSSEVVYIIFLALKYMGKTLEQSKKWEYDIVSIDNITKYVNLHVE